MNKIRIESEGYDPNQGGRLEYNLFDFKTFYCSLDFYFKHEPTPTDYLFSYLLKHSTTTQLKFLERIRYSIEISDLKPNFKLIKKKIWSIDDPSFKDEFKQLIFEKLKEAYNSRSTKGKFISNKILPFSHPVRRRIFNKIKLKFDIELRPPGFSKNRSSNLHDDEIFKILSYKEKEV